MRRRAIIGRVVTLALLGVVVSPCLAVTDVTIGNGPASPDGSYLNAGNIASTLSFTNVNVTATSSITIADDIDLSTSVFGPTFFDLSLQAPTLYLTHNIIIGAGNVHVNGPTVNLAGRATTAAGALLAGSRIPGIATQVNVLADTGSLQQALDLASSASPVTVNVAGGLFTGNLSVAKKATLIGNAGDPLVPGADPAAPRIVGTSADGTVVTVTSTDVTLRGFILDALVNGGALNDSDLGLSSAAANLTIDNDTFTGFDIDAVAATSPTGLNIHHNLCAGSGRDGINVSGATSPLVTSNLIRGSGAVAGAGRNGITVGSCPGATVDNNTIEGLAGGTGAANDGILLQSSNNAFLRNTPARTDGAGGSVDAAHLPFEIATSTGVADTGNQDTSPATENGLPPSALRVTKGPGSSLTLTFGVSCHTVDGAVYWGQAAGLMTGAAWTNAACGLRTAGSATVSPGTPVPGGLIYLVAVAGNGTTQGSYGRDSSGLERPPAAGLGACSLPQLLGGTCP